MKNESLSIGHLIMLLKEEGLSFPVAVMKAESLTDYAVRSSYPEMDETEKKEYSEAVKLATKVFEWAKSVIRKNPRKLF